MPILLKLSEVGPPDQHQTWEKAMDMIRDAGGGHLQVDIVGEARVRKTVVLPRGIPLHIQGLGRRISTITGILRSDQPVFEWEATGAKNADNITWRDMAIRHLGGGTTIKHRKVEGSNNRLIRSIFENLLLTTNGNSAATILDLESVRASKFSDLLIIGATQGGTGFRLRGNNLFLSRAIAPIKATSPQKFLDFSGTHFRMISCRTDGGSSPEADYHFSDSQQVEVQSVTSEGHLSTNIVLVENCRDINFTSCAIARQRSGRVPDSTGIRFVNSNFCTIRGGLAGARFDSDGFSIIFDRNSHFNTIDSFRIIATRFQGQNNQILDRGTNNRWRVAATTEDDNGTSFISLSDSNTRDQQMR